jgi:hypothetical protein
MLDRHITGVWSANRTIPLVTVGPSGIREAFTILFSVDDPRRPMLPCLLRAEKPSRMTGISR